MWMAIRRVRVNLNLGNGVISLCVIDLSFGYLITCLCGVRSAMDVDVVVHKMSQLNVYSSYILSGRVLCVIPWRTYTESVFDAMKGRLFAPETITQKLNGEIGCQNQQTRIEKHRRVYTLAKFTPSFYVSRSMNRVIRFIFASYLSFVSPFAICIWFISFC